MKKMAKEAAALLMVLATIFGAIAAIYFGFKWLWFFEAPLAVILGVVGIVFLLGATA